MTIFSRAALALFAVLGACATPEPSSCDPDASAPLVLIQVAGGIGCTRRALAIPNREDRTCADPSIELGGARVRLEAEVGARWSLRLDRADGAPSAICAAALDETCGCAPGVCTANTSEPMLFMDLGVVDRDGIDVMIGAGVYDAELCAY